MAETPAWVKSGNAPSWVGAAKTAGGASTEEPFEAQARATRDVTPAELIAANPIVRALTSAAEPVFGAAALMEAPFGGTGNAERIKQLRGMQERGAAALGFSPAAQTLSDVAGSVLSPVSVAAMKAPAAASAVGRIAQGGGFGALSNLLTPSDAPKTGKEALEKAKSVAASAALGSAAATAPEAITKATDFIKPLWQRLTAPKTLPTTPVSGSADTVRRELQRTKDVMESPKTLDISDPSKLSAPEKLIYRQKELVDQLPTIFQTAKPVDLSNAMSAAKSTIQQEVDKGILSAAKEAQATLDRAIEKASGGGANQLLSGMSASQRNQWGAFLSGQSKKAPEVNLEMADRIRQSLQDDIDRIGEGQLSKRAQQLVANVRDAVTGASRTASPRYGEYLDEYSKASKGLEKYRLEGGVMSKLTRTNGAFEELGAHDSQNLLKDIFSGKTPDRDMSHLVELTKHSGKSTQALREAYGEWLAKPTSKTNLPLEKTLTDNWDKTRNAVEKSGLFTSDHVANINKVMDDLRNAGAATAAKHYAASAAGFLIGSLKGHPFLGMHVARDLSTGTNTEPVRNAIQEAVGKQIFNPENAALLAAPATPENISKVMKIFNQAIQEAKDVVAQTQTPTAGRLAGATVGMAEDQRKRVANPFGQLGLGK